MNDDDLSPEARELVDLARGSRTPSEEQRDRAFQALMAGLAGGAGLSTGQLAAAKVAGKSSLIWLKWALPAFVVASAGVGAYLFAGRHSAPAAGERAAAVSSPSAVPTPSLGPVVADSDSAPLAVSAAPEPSAAPPKAPSAPLKPSAEDLVQELSLLHQALAESRSGHAARALELARQHAQRYPNSRLRVERDAIQVRSLCALGRAAEARKIADRLPNSPVSAALQETCVGK